MPLDPQVRVFLDQMAEMGSPALHEVSVAEARAMMDQMGALQGEGEPVHEVRDATAPGPGGPIPVRIYRPEASGPLPLIVFLHGGGWVLGSRDSHDATCRALTNRIGAVLVSVEYRLAPEHPFPAGPEDAYAALTWAVAEAASLGADPTRLAVAGDSAGGNLAAAVALMARDRGGPAIRQQVLVYPVIDGTREHPSYEENSDGYFLTKEGMRWFWGHYVPDAAQRSAPYASPITATDLTGLPPALILTAEFDPLRDEGEAYGERLAAAGVPATVQRWNGQIHGFFGMAALFDEAQRAFDETARAMAEALA